MKKLNPTPEQTFLILSMLFGETEEEREPYVKKLSIKAPARRALEEAGLIRLEKRKGGGRVILEDDAWDFATENLAGELPKTPRAARVLRAVLAKVQRSLQTQDQGLAAFVSGESEVDDSTIGDLAQEGHEPSGAPDEDQIRAACLALTHGQTKKRVRLSDLRRKLSTSRESLDHLLVAMQEAGRLVLYRMDNTAEITPEDERAALSIAGQPRHLVYLEA